MPPENREGLQESTRIAPEVTVYATEVFDGYDDLYVYVCPYCRRQHTGPRGHRTAGDDLATSCFHSRPGERGVVQPRLVRIKVEPAEPFIPAAIPPDSPRGHR